LSPGARQPPFHRSLSARLLALTVLFVMLAEVLIYAPSIGRYRKAWLEERLDDAHLAILALEATPDGMVDAALQSRLLAHAGTSGIYLYRSDGTSLMLGPDMPQPAAAVYDLRETGFFGFIADAFKTLAGGDGRRLIKVVGRSSHDGRPVIEVLVPEAPLREDMIGYSGRILALSLVISVITAALVYASLHRLLVRPMRRLTEAMLAFREAPEDARRTIEPGERLDEVGTAERALSEMQRDLRAALTQKARLAALGSAVAKISHDLRAILSSAMVVSERLEASADPEVRRLAPTVVKSVDRAVELCSHTLRYVREGSPTVRLGPVALAGVIDEAAAAVQSEFPNTVWRCAVPPDLSVVADRDLLFRILANLGRNAAEAGAATLRIEAVPGPDRLELLIADDGTGLPPVARQNLFRPFAGSARPGGAGLGLAIARELAAAQGGGLDLDGSGPGGTTFRLALPWR